MTREHPEGIIVHDNWDLPRGAKTMLPDASCTQPTGRPVALPVAAVCGRVYKRSHTPFACNVYATVKPNRRGSMAGALDQEATQSRVTAARRWFSTDGSANVPPRVPDGAGARAWLMSCSLARP